MLIALAPRVLYLGVGCVWPSISNHDMADEARQRQRRNALRKSSRRKREERISVGDLDPERDFVCPFCNGVYSLYYG